GADGPWALGRCRGQPGAGTRALGAPGPASGRQRAVRLSHRGAWCNLGNLKKLQGDARAAVDRYDRAIAVLEAVPGKETAGSARQYLRNACFGRASTLVSLERFGDAVRAWERVMALTEPEARASYRFPWAIALARSGEPERAAREAIELTT